MHALRHYYASILIRHSESITTVQERLGHSSAVTTLNAYSHLWPTLTTGHGQPWTTSCGLLRTSRGAGD